MPLTRRPAASLKRLVAMSKETGYLDTALASYALDTTGTITLLNAVPQGVAVTQRVGKKILLKSLSVPRHFDQRNDCHGQRLRVDHRLRQAPYRCLAVDY